MRAMLWKMTEQVKVLKNIWTAVDATGVRRSRSSFHSLG